MKGNSHLIIFEGDFEKVSQFEYLGALITENNEVGKEANHRLNLGNTYYLLFSWVPGFFLETLNLEYINP